MIRKNITITEEQAAFVAERNINLSRLVQKQLNKDIDDRKFYQSSLEGLREIERGQYKDMSWDDFEKEMLQWISEGLKDSKKSSGSSTPKHKSKSSSKSEKSASIHS